ncbi:hypothetical protein OXU80_04170 [Jeongeupella avenae]|uniref:Uncharacterized protein n=1 Tax=Antarcticirhabdus aurantiaca TaxID=2606717 RepID=A0ACD4NS14_9HYPH|nr:hypothetical protein [Antarcticirhabdus aurantiaca]WAJ29441.1 hypothetical protein OXU80_04170 [Jeongeuplla avenae]
MKGDIHAHRCVQAVPSGIFPMVGGEAAARLQEDGLDEPGQDVLVELPREVEGGDEVVDHVDARVALWLRGSCLEESVGIVPRYLSLAMEGAAEPRHGLRFRMAVDDPVGGGEGRSVLVRLPQAGRERLRILWVDLGGEARKRCPGVPLLGCHAEGRADPLVGMHDLRSRVEAPEAEQVVPRSPADLSRRRHRPPSTNVR